MADPTTGDQTYDAMFEQWARAKLDHYAKQYPDKPPLTWEDFDGCTFVPDICLPCCLIHDVFTIMAET